MNNKVIDILNTVGLIASCIGMFCTGCAKYSRIQNDVKKEVSRQMNEKNEKNERRDNYEKVVKKSK